MSTAIATPQANYDQAHQHDPSSSDGVLLLTKKRRLTYILPLHLSSTAGRLKLPGKKDWVDSFSCSTSPGFHHSTLILPVRSDDADHKPVSQPPSPSPSASASHEDHYYHHDYHPTHSLGINSLAIDLTTPIKHIDKPNGILYSAGRDGLIAAWELNLPTKLCTHSTGQQHPRFQVDPIQLHQRPPTTFRQCIQSHTDWCNDILLCNQNQTLISASSDRTVKAWSPHSPQNSLCPTTIGTHQDYVKCLTHSPFCAWVASAGLDRRILLWDTNESRPNPLVKFSENLVGTSIYSLTTTPTGQLLAAGSPAQAISLYDPRLSSQVAKLVGHTDNVRSILLSEDGSRLLSASSDATVKMWDVRIQRCLHTFSHHSTSVWALHSQHPRLEMFHSGDRAGWLCKVDLEACADFREGECVVLGQAGRREHLTPNALNAPHQGIAKIVALDDAFVWTATGSSTVERWKDIPTRIQRRQAASLIHSAQDSLHSPPPDSKLTSSRATFDSNYSPPQSPHQPPQLAPHPCSPQSVSLNVDTSSSSQSSSVVHHPPLSSDPAHDPLPPSSTSITQSSPQFSSNTHLPSHVQPDELDGVPLEALVPLFSQFDHLLHHPESQDPESTTIHSPNSVVSDPNLHKAGLNYFTHSSMSTVSLRPPTFYGLEPIKILSPLTLETKLDNLHTPTVINPHPHTPTVINPHPHTPTVINPHPRPSITTTSAWKLYITRDSAAEAVPLRDSPDDTITGCSGLTKSELLNDGRHAITIDTMGRIALWDIISCSCKGVFDPDDLERKFDSGSSVGSSRSLSKSNPSELLKLVKERIEGQATVGTWCTVEIQTGLLAVHLDENRCFDGEVYADEAGLSEEVLGQMKEDHRISLGKWIISNLFEGFVKHQTRLRLQNEVTAKVPNAHDATSPTNTIQSGGEVDSDEQKTSDERSEFSYSHHLAGKPFVPRTPGMTIALATTALTPAILPDLKTVVGSNWATKNNQHGGDSASHHHDYFSLPRLVETDEEQLADGGVTPGGLDSCTDASSSYSSSLNPLPSPRRASPALASNDGFSNGQLAESSAASWTSTATTSSSAVQPNSANIFSRFRSLGRGQKRRNSQDQNAPPVISNPIPYREDGDQAEQDAQKRILAEKTKVQQAHMVQSILSQPFQPCGEVDAPKLTLPPETTILISEEEPESGAWEVSYRGLVSTTHLDIDILMNVLPGWLLGFLHGNRVSAKEGGGAIKVTFVLQPEDGKDIVGLPELPNGNARLTASRVLRMKKVAAYVFQKLESSAPKHDDQHEPPPPSSSSSSKTPSESAYQHKSHKANSKSIGSAASTGSSATTTSNTNHHHHQHHQHHHHSNHHRHHNRETLDHQPHATNGEVTPTSASPHPYPQAHQPPLDETQIVLSCNGKLLPRSLTLGVVKQWVWARPGDVVIHYRRDTLALPT